jgi:hypothetical protein
MRKIQLEGEAVRTALRSAGEGRKKAVTVIVEAFPGDEADAVVYLRCHHMGLDLRVLLLKLPV